MKRLPNPSVDSSLGVPEFPEKSCQNNWNPHEWPVIYGSNYTLLQTPHYEWGAPGNRRSYRD